MTSMSAHSRLAQSNGITSMAPSISERSQGTHGNIGSGLGRDSNWNMRSLWDSDTDQLSRTALEGRAGSSSLLASSESDGWNNSRRNVPWLSRTQTNGIATSPVQGRSADPSVFSLPNGNDAAAAYLTRSAGTGQLNYLDSGSERVSPSGEGNAVSSYGILTTDDRRQLNFSGSPAATGFQTQSGFADRLQNTRSEEAGSMNMPSQRISRNGFTHTSHNSASFAPQRLGHNSYPSFHSERQFEDLEAGMERLQMGESHHATSRPPIVSHASLDSSLNRLGHPNPSDPASYQAIQHAMQQSFANEVMGPEYQAGYQPVRSSRLSESDLVPPTEYAPMDGAFYTARLNPPNTARRRNGFISNNVSHNQAAMMQSRVREFHSLGPNQQPPNTLQNQGFVYNSSALVANVYPHAVQINPALAYRRPPRENITPQESPHGPVLTEFKNHHKTRKFELKDIFGSVCEFTGDQHGSRFLQTRLESANSDDKERVFNEIQPNTLQLAQDIFGNYVIQKLFEHGNQSQKRILANHMKGHVYSLSTAPYGCRVVQKALEHVLVDQQALLVKELEERVLDCVSDNNGNHVIQKAIERVPTQYTKFVVEAFKGQVEKQAMHSYGCRVIQRMLEYCEEDDRRSLLTELHACTARLIEDQFGNYVIQHVIQHGEEADRSIMIEVVMQKLLSYSRHKFASNVVEKSIEFGNVAQSREIIGRLTTEMQDGRSVLDDLVGDQYGNYVVQKICNHVAGEERVELVERLKPLVARMKRQSGGKQIQAFEKLLDESSTAPNVAVPASNHSSTTPPNSHKSSPQPPKRSVEDCFVDTPPTPPPTDSQA
ncbi:mRNA-binding protein PUF3 [Aspergillus lucknowensis]|uniref:Armadillo-type protein n=1 Tax=Aspergillus lucknowensis TaxID=176173 RepID=A0ABR4M412_9EURO